MRVAVVGDGLVIEGLKAILAPYRDRIEVAGTALRTEDVASQVMAMGAEVVLFDVHQPRSASSLALAAKLLANSPPFRLVVYTDANDERHLFEALRLGASGYLLHSMSGAALAEHLERAHGGEVVIDPTVATGIVMRVALGPQVGWAGIDLGLTRRESEVLSLLGDGLSNSLIASQLIIGKETVKTHLRSLYRKLGVKDRAQAVALALRQGIFT